MSNHEKQARTTGASRVPSVTISIVSRSRRTASRGARSPVDEAVFGAEPHVLMDQEGKIQDGGALLDTSFSLSFIKPLFAPLSRARPPPYCFEDRYRFSLGLSPYM